MGERKVVSGAGLEDLLAQCMERFETEGEAGLLAALQQHPQHAEAVRARLDELRAAGLLQQAPAPHAPLPRRLGDYELGAVIGGGGMGTVFRARQRSLGRDVAVKVIRADRLHLVSARARFQRELQALAQLRHPGIVPVHGGGEDQGIPYFAMELVEGCTLERALAGLSGQKPASLRGADLAEQVALSSGGPAAPGAELFAGSWVETACRIVRQVAAALQHAHAHGVVHRDVKPSNIMLQSDGRVLLFDFGLVWQAGAERMTRDGAVGSPAYMAPEQLREAALDARTDVYGLGVTLYELLALEHPFLASSEHELRQRILVGDRVPVRHRNRSVPWEVETICQVAMDQDPGRRYATAEAFEHDLAAVLQHRPIHARRPGALLRARRWAERHPTLATALLLLLLLGVGLPTLLWRTEAQASRRIEQQRNRAQANERLALQAVNRFLRDMGGDDLQFVPRMQEKGRALLEDSLAFYEQLLRAGADDALLRLDHGAALRDLAWVQMQFGQAEAALANSLRAIERLLPALQDPAQRAAALSLCGYARCEQGTMRRSLGHWAEAEAAFRMALDDFAALAALGTHGRSARAGEADVQQRLASLLRELGRIEEAVPGYQRAHELLSALVPELPEDEHLPLRLAQVHHSLALVRLGNGDRAAAEAHGKAELDLLERLRQRPGRFGGVDLQYGNALVLLAGFHDDRGDLDTARQHFATAVAAIEQALADFPGAVGLSQGLGKALAAQGEFLWRANQRDAAWTAFERATGLLAPLPDPAGAEEAPSFDRVRLLRRMATARREAGNGEAAETLLRQAVAEAAGASAVHRQVVAYRIELARCRNDLGILLSRRAQLEEAEREHEAALALKQELVQQFPARPAYRQSLAASWNNLARMRQQRGDPDGARQAYEQAVAEKDAVLRVDPAVAESHHSLASSLHNLAGLWLEQKQPAAAQPLLQRAAACARDAVRLNPSDRGFRRQLVNTCEALSWAHLALGTLDAVLPLAAEIVAADAGDAVVPVRAAMLAGRVLGHAAVTAELRARCEQDGVGWLREGIRRGYADKATLQQSDYLEPLRRLPAFAALVEAIGK
ncbi:MAG: serine/threonine protein kinase [Planctomycetes bacterium]|nr:serine/threonine protein kinase [Planctomycetota bacterium]